MDDFLSELRRERAVRMLLPLFFVSGATALVYQTLWARQLNLVFGTSTFAISTVLATFMAGLAVGGFLMARWVERLGRPLAVYGGLEILIGLYALVFPSILGGVEPVYLWAGRAFAPGALTFGLIQFALVGVALVVPTAAMGATLPVLARFATARLGAAGDRIGTLYAVNTTGAVFGTVVAGFYLLPGVGLWSTTVLAAGANLLLGASAVGLSRWSGGGVVPETSAEHVAVPRSMDLGLVCGVAALSGFAALLYEVAWTRVLALTLGASVYAFSVMLIAFLVGIAIGGGAGGRLADRTLARAGRRRLLSLLLGLQVGIGVLAYGLLWVFGELPFWYVTLFDWLDVSARSHAFVGLGLLLAGVIMAPPALLMGATFPVAVRAAVGDPERLGAPVARVYGWNTVGSTLGAFTAGFVLLPVLSVQTTVLIGVAVNLLAAAVVGVALASRRARAGWGLAWAGVVALLFVAIRPPWDPLVMTAGLYKYASYFTDHSRAGVRQFATGRTRLLYYDEGLSSVVTVAENLKSGNIYLANNGKVDASSSGDMPTQVLLGLLPMQFTTSRDNVLVIGLASGVTVGAVTRLLDVSHIDVVELEPAVVEAEHFFDAFNHRAVEDPRVNVVENDGRNHLLLSAPGAYDVVISEPPNPWITGVANLFTRDFFELGKTRLAPGGVWAQWVHLYGMAPSDLRSLLGTFADAYPYVAVYGTIEDADLVMVGSARPLEVGLDGAQRLWGHSPALRKELRRVDVDSPMMLTSRYLFDRDAALELADGVGRNTDDNMRIEYAAPYNLHLSTHGQNSAMLIGALQVPQSYQDPDVLEELAWVYRERDDYVRAVKSLLRAARIVGGEEARARGWGDLVTEWRRELSER